MAFSALTLCGAVEMYGQKVAYVATEAIMEKLTDAKTARAKLAELQQGWMREIQRSESEITKLQADIETNRLLWSAQEKRDAEAKLADMEAKLAQFRMAKFGPKQEFERQQAELMGPIVEKIAKAIEDEAKAQKYDYVVDKSSRGMVILYANPANDLTWAVLKRLGVEPDSSMPAMGAPLRMDGDPRTEQDAKRNRGGRRESQPVEKPLDPNESLKDDPNNQGGDGTGQGTGGDGKP